jgi:hypothetical protein
MAEPTGRALTVRRYLRDSDEDDRRAMRIQEDE